jgi:hypothetical protein
MSFRHTYVGLGLIHKYVRITSTYVGSNTSTRHPGLCMYVGSGIARLQSYESCDRIPPGHSVVA